VPGVPNYRDVQAKATLCSLSCGHTWFDHGYNVFALPDGSTGLQGNHSPADAMTALFAIRYIQEAVRAGSVRRPAQLMEQYNKRIAGGGGGTAGGGGGMGTSSGAANCAALEAAAVTPLPFALEAWRGGEAAVAAATSHARALYDSVDVRVVECAIGSEVGAHPPCRSPFHSSTELNLLNMVLSPAQRHCVGCIRPW
jgi:hypothetical protein